MIVPSTLLSLCRMGVLCTERKPSLREMATRSPKRGSVSVLARVTRVPSFTAMPQGLEPGSRLSMNVSESSENPVEAWMRSGDEPSLSITSPCEAP